MARQSNILQTRFFYVATVGVVCFGLILLMWRLRGMSPMLMLFGFGWAIVMTAFAYEIVTRAERLNRIVHSRTNALEETNRNLSALLDQLSAFHQISYEVSQKLEIKDTTRAFTSQLYKMLEPVDGAWLWLDRAFVRSDGSKSATRYETRGPLVLVTQAGHSFGLPPPMRVMRPSNPLCAACFEDGSVPIHHNLTGKGLAWGWKWLAASGMQSFAAVPLRMSFGMLGILGVFSRHQISVEFASQLQLATNQLTVALEKARLLREMRKRADELAAANQELLQLDAMKDWFVSSVSHELRTPLTNIRSFSEILETYNDVEDGERQEFAKIIREESERLSHLIDDLLDLAKIAKGAIGLNAEETDLRPLVERCCRLFSQEADERGIRLAWNVPEDVPTVFADPDAVVRVLTNLLGNAFKFTEDGGTVSVSVRQERAGSGELRFVGVRVTDDGIGISQKDQSRVFERFTQVESAAKGKPSGTGIGLAICREVVENSGGRIWVRSTQGKGSTFGFTLPAVRENVRAGPSV